MAFVWYGIAFACKLQAIFLLPFILCLYFYRKRFSIALALIAVGVFWLTGLPAFIMGLVILLPIIGGALIPLLPFSGRKQMMIYIETVVCITSFLVLSLLWKTPKDVLPIFYFSKGITISLALDGLGKIFAGMVAFLWPLAILFSFEYMKHEGHEKYFFMFYVITYGVTLGVAQAENILTLYVFFEALSLITLPLIMHTLTKEAIHAARTYFYFMIGGAAFAFILSLIHI